MRRVGIDTNVLLRLLVDEDPAQRARVMRFGQRLNVEMTGLVTIVSLLEVDWALRSQYGYTKLQSMDAIRQIVSLRGVTIENHDVVVRAIALVRDRNADFADALIAGLSAELDCDATVTLDRRAAHRVPGMELLA
ncbi:MAG: type II toxin-antitoxin system VapC family toxin [Roseitalea porphyridii]|jgi:predicted nucleic-acid-binding protein|uniref:PIN domain-containing protein n=1 Tax=Roseitalea porphyridii TaxID=1852022 RepID=UPI0032F03A5C